jgi:rSAM/selenodomain-associated transferase 1
MRPINKNRRVLVLAKAPRPGLAKTRLIPVLGAEGAAALQARLVEHTLQTVTSAGLGRIELHGTPAEDDFLRDRAARYETRLVPQSDGDLGARMFASLSCALSESASAILVGTDCPALTPHVLRRAARVLETGSEAVFVPTEDGGYALVGLTRCDPRLFDAISWGSTTVMSDTREHLQALGWRWAELETLWDVDTPEDYERLVASRLLGARGRS